MNSRHTHAIKFYIGNRWEGWDCPSEESARKKFAEVMSRGIESVSPTGNVTIIPPWRITKVTIKPIRHRNPPQLRPVLPDQSSSDEVRQ